MAFDVWSRIPGTFTAQQMISMVEKIPFGFISNAVVGQHYFGTSSPRPPPPSRHLTFLFSPEPGRREHDVPEVGLHLVRHDARPGQRVRDRGQGRNYARAERRDGRGVARAARGAGRPREERVPRVYARRAAAGVVHARLAGYFGQVYDGVW